MSSTHPFNPNLIPQPQQKVRKSQEFSCMGGDASYPVFDAILSFSPSPTIIIILNNIYTPTIRSEKD